jgi:hypothetical protein
VKLKQQKQQQQQNKRLGKQKKNNMVDIVLSSIPDGKFTQTELSSTAKPVKFNPVK